MAKDMQSVLQAYQTGVQGGGPKYSTGVKAAAGDWEQQAKSPEAEARYAASMQRAIEQQSRRKALQNVTAAQWAGAASEQGARNYSAAAARAAVNYNKALPTILAAGDEAKAAARQIPGETMGQRLERSRAASIAVHRRWAREHGVEPEL